MARTKEKEEKETVNPMLAAMLDKVKIKGKISIGGVPSERPRISTGSLSLDLKLGGGIASDRIVEYYGPSGSCKTSMALVAVKNYIDKFGYDRPPAVIDIERTLTDQFIRAYGIDTDRIIYARPNTAEETMDIISALLRSGQVGIGVLDSVDGLESEEDYKKSYSEGSMMKLPKLLSEAMRDLSKATADFEACLILINQCRTGIKNFQTVETTSGGSAIPYYASQRVRFSSRGPHKEYKGALDIKAAPKKNKLWPGLIKAETEFPFIPGKGIHELADKLNAAQQFGVLRSAGPMLYLLVPENGPYEVIGKVGENDDSYGFKWKGRDAFNEWLTEAQNSVIFNTLVKEAFSNIRSDITSDTDEDTSDDE